MTWTNFRRFLGALSLVLAVAYGATAGLMGSPVLDAPAAAQTGGTVPGNWSGSTSDTA